MCLRESVKKQSQKCYSINYLSSSVAANLVNIENNSDMISSVSAQADLTLQRVDQTEAAINVNSIAINDLEGTG